MLRSTINSGSAGWMSAAVSVIKGWGEKTGEDCILFLMFCWSRVRLSRLLFSGCQTKREGRWRGRHPGGREEGGWWWRGAERERWRGC